MNEGVCETMHADVKRGSRRHVEEISEEDYLFSLDVRIFVFVQGACEEGKLTSACVCCGAGEGV